MGHNRDYISMLLPDFGPRVDPYPQKIADFTPDKEGKKEPAIVKVENKDSYITVGQDDYRKYTSLLKG